MLAPNWRQHILATPLGNENLAIMADPSHPSNMTAHDKILEECRREYDRAVKSLFLSRCHTIEQGVMKIKECQLPSTIDILMEMQSLGTLSDVLSDFVQYLIDQEDSSISAPVIQKLAIEKSVVNSCKTFLWTQSIWTYIFLYTNNKV